MRGEIVSDYNFFIFLFLFSFFCIWGIWKRRDLVREVIRILNHSHSLYSFTVAAVVGGYHLCVLRHPSLSAYV